MGTMKGDFWLLMACDMSIEEIRPLVQNFPVSFVPGSVCCSSVLCLYIFVVLPVYSSFLSLIFALSCPTQAMDRAHRIGQKKVVNVYRLVTRGTLEEKIMGFVTVCQSLSLCLNARYNVQHTAYSLYRYRCPLVFFHLIQLSSHTCNILCFECPQSVQIISISC